MKNKKRFVSIFLCLIAVLSAMSVTAFASNWTDSSFTNFSITDSGNNLMHFLPGRAKEDNTASYLYITNSTNRYTLVWVYGGENPNSTDRLEWDMCYSPDSDVYGYVICQRGTKYSIYSDVYTQGYTYATLRFESIYGGDSLTGVWSPDSRGTYATPEGM